MKAIQVIDDGKALKWAKAPTPQPGPGEVRIQVAATACNRADLLQRRGLYPPPKGASPILGLDVSGIIESVGDNVTDWSVGDKVCALLPGGGYAEYVTVPAAMLLPVPSSIRLVEAAAIPEVFYTAFVNLFLEADYAPGDSVLVHAAASGVGTAALQICLAFESPVYGTASQRKIDFLQKMGVTLAIDRENEDFSARIDGVTDHGGVDIIVDPVGGDYFERNLHLLKPQGRLVIIGLLGGAQAEISLSRLLRRRLRVIGSVLRSRSPAEKVAITKDFSKTLWPLFERGKLQPVIDHVFPITDAEKAHKLLEDNATIGKIVLVVDDALT